jgi:hypothetical protein
MFKDLQKLTKYNWGQVSKNLIPSGNSTVMADEDAKKIQKGAIIRIIGAAVYEAMIVITAISLVRAIYGAMGLSSYVQKILDKAIESAIQSHMGEWIWQFVLAAIVPICALVYVIVMKKKAQNGWPIFILLLVVLAQSAWVIYDTIRTIAGAGGALGVIFSVSAISGILMIVCCLVSLLAVLIGSSSIAVGCIEFLQKQHAAAPAPAAAPTAANAAAPAIGSYQPTATPVAPAAPVAPVAPAAPVTPVEPVAAAPVAPVAPQPAEPVAPVAPAPVEPVAPAAPAPEAPIAPAAPAAPVEPTEPVFDPNQNGQF